MLGKPFSDPGRFELDDERLAPAVEAVGTAIANVMTQIAELGLQVDEPIGERLAQALRAQVGALPRKDGVEWSAELRSGPAGAAADLCVVADIKLGQDPMARAFLLRLERAERIGEQREGLRDVAKTLLEHTPAAAIGVIDAPSGILAVPAEDHSSLTFPARERGVALEDVFRACFAGAFGDHSHDLDLVATRSVVITAQVVW